MSETPAEYKIEPDCKCARCELEREIVTLRANLERLAQRWQQSADEIMDLSDGDLDGAITDLRRVLSGETPPAPGEEWSPKPLKKLLVECPGCHSVGVHPRRQKHNPYGYVAHVFQCRQCNHQWRPSESWQDEGEYANDTEDTTKPLIVGG